MGTGQSSDTICRRSKKQKKLKVESHGKPANTTQSHVDVMECRVLQYSAGKRKQVLYSPLKLLSKVYIGISLVSLYLFSGLYVLGSIILYNIVHEELYNLLGELGNPHH